jgi:hypothetical protein
MSVLELRPPRQRARYVDEIGPVVCMVVRDRYVMVRRPRETPFVISLTEWHKRAQTKPTEKPLHPTQTLMLKAIADAEGGEATNRDLRVALNLKERTVRNRLREFRLAKIIYVSRWIAPEGAGKHRPVFAIGNKKDAPEPKFNPKKASEKYRKKMRLVINAKARKQTVTPFSGLLA